MTFVLGISCDFPEKLFLIFNCTIQNCSKIVFEKKKKIKPTQRKQQFIFTAHLFNSTNWAVRLKTKN